MSKFDTIIVGQGLAGSLLAMRLLNDGLKVMVVDNHHHGAASRVAAGIINPITGHRLNKTEGFDAFYTTAKATYTQLNRVLGRAAEAALLVATPQQRLIKNRGQADYLEKRLNDSEYQAFLTRSAHGNEEHSLEIKDVGFGCVEIHHTGVVDTKALLEAVGAYLEARNILRQTEFDYSALDCSSNEVRYKDLTAKAIIFCEGYQAIHNPWLKDLPFKLAKGDVLSVEEERQEHTNTPSLLNWGSWLLRQTASQNYKLGSSYVWNSLDQSPSVENAEKLLLSAETHLGKKFKVVGHEVGIRPTTLHRIPFIGALSNLDNAYCFNGFGSKGCLLIPYYAEQLSAHLRCKQTLHEDLYKWL